MLSRSEAEGRGGKCAARNGRRIGEVLTGGGIGGERGVDGGGLRRAAGVALVEPGRGGEERAGEETETWRGGGAPGGDARGGGGGGGGGEHVGAGGGGIGGGGRGWDGIAGEMER